MSFLISSLLLSLFVLILSYKTTSLFLLLANCKSRQIDIKTKATVIISNQETITLLINTKAFTINNIPPKLVYNEANTYIARSWKDAGVHRRRYDCKNELQDDSQARWKIFARTSHAWFKAYFHNALPGSRHPPRDRIHMGRSFGRQQHYFKNLHSSRQKREVTAWRNKKIRLRYLISGRKTRRKRRLVNYDNN